MKRIRIVAAFAVASLFVGVIALALSVTMTGSGSIGHVAGWAILESCTPSMPGDSRGSMGTATVRAQAKSDSRFVMDNEALLESPGGSWRGRVSEVGLDALGADLSLVGPAQFLNVDKTMPPVWLDDEAALSYAFYGPAVGQVALVYDIAVDPSNDVVYVSSYDFAGARNRVLKFDSAGTFLLEFGTSPGSGDGQFGAAGPSGLALKANGNILVFDGDNARVQEFTPSGVFVAKFGTAGAGNGQFGVSIFNNIAVSPIDGSVVVTDRGNNRGQRFNSSYVYQSQVALGDFFGAWDVAIDSAGLIYFPRPADYGTLSFIKVYNSAFALQATIPWQGPYESTLNLDGFMYVDFADDGSMWASPARANYVAKYTSNGYEVDRAYSTAPVSAINEAYRSAHVNGRAYLLGRPLYNYAGSTALPRVVVQEYVTIQLSSAVQRYMEACDPSLNGWTLDYQAASDPDVVFPGWSGNVWANLKELFAIYGVELVADHATQTFIIRDIGSATTTISNFGPNGVTTHPVNLTGGRVVDVVYQQPRAGHGVVWDAATENVPLSIAAGARTTKILYTENHPAELAQPVPTDTLPIQLGQYYVIDSTGTHVPADVWLYAGGGITTSVGESPGTVSATLIGPSAAIDGYTGPFSFATGNTPTDTPALSIVGNGTFTNPTTFVKAESQGQPFNSPFMDSLDRVLQRGHYGSMQDPNVIISFTCPITELPPIGQAGGTLFPYDDSIYRITDVEWGNLEATVTAERYVTIEDIDDLWFSPTVLGDVVTNYTPNPLFASGGSDGINQTQFTGSITSDGVRYSLELTTTSAIQAVWRLAENTERMACSTGQERYAVVTIRNTSAGPLDYNAQIRSYTNGPTNATLGTLLTTYSHGAVTIAAGAEYTFVFNATITDATVQSVVLSVARAATGTPAIGDTCRVLEAYLSDEALPTGLDVFSGSTTDGTAVGEYQYAWVGGTGTSPSTASELLYVQSTIGQFDTAWDGYSLGDIQVQPLRP